jgi:hypothetical protein
MSTEIIGPAPKQSTAPELSSALPVEGREYPLFRFSASQSAQRYFDSLCSLGVIDAEDSQNAADDEWEIFLRSNAMRQIIRIMDYSETVCTHPHFAVDLARCYTCEEIVFDDGISLGVAISEPEYDRDIRKDMVASARNRSAELYIAIDTHDLDPNPSFDPAPLHRELAVLHNFILELKEQKRKVK